MKQQALPREEVCVNHRQELPLAAAWLQQSQDPYATDESTVLFSFGKNAGTAEEIEEAFADAQWLEWIGADRLARVCQGTSAIHEVTAEWAAEVVKKALDEAGFGRMFTCEGTAGKSNSPTTRLRVETRLISAFAGLKLPSGKEKAPDKSWRPRVDGVKTTVLLEVANTETKPHVLEKAKNYFMMIHVSRCFFLNVLSVIDAVLFNRFSLSFSSSSTLVASREALSALRS